MLAKLRDKRKHTFLICIFAIIKLVTKRKQKPSNNTDSGFFLKLVILVIVGSIWLKASKGSSWQLPLPIGLIAGLFLVSKESIKQDRKLGYAVLLVAMLVGFWTPIGIFVSI